MKCCLKCSLTSIVKGPKKEQIFSWGASQMLKRRKIGTMKKRLFNVRLRNYVKLNLMTLYLTLAT